MLPADEETHRWDYKEKRRPYTSTQAGRESNMKFNPDKENEVYVEILKNTYCKNRML